MWNLRWKRAARHYRALLKLQSSEREAFWKKLANASPRLETARELDKVRHEAETLHQLLIGIQADLRGILSENLVSSPVRRMLEHIVKRWKDRDDSGQRN